MNRQKAIQKIIRKLKRVIGLHVDSVRQGHCERARREQRELQAMIRAAIETDWEP